MEEANDEDGEVVKAECKDVGGGGESVQQCDECDKVIVQSDGDSYSPSLLLALHKCSDHGAAVPRHPCEVHTACMSIITKS